MNSVEKAAWLEERAGRARVLARPAALEAVRAAVEKTGSLFEWAVGSPGAQRLEGRGPAYRVRVEHGDWLVRHYRRGGAVAVHLGDRYLRLGAPRPFLELEASRAARRRGIATPAVVAAVVYPAGMFYRGDIAVEFIPRSRTLAEAFTDATGGTAAGPDIQDTKGTAAARAAGAAVRQAHDRGLVHPDLNVRNILLAETGAGLRGYILDLDGARVVETVSEGARRRMLRRFWRSVRKWERFTERTLPESVKRALEAGYATGSAHA